MLVAIRKRLERYIRLKKYTNAMEFDASNYEGPLMKADEVVAMRTLFEACDTDGSGAIPLKEFKSRLVVERLQQIDAFQPSPAS